MRAFIAVEMPRHITAELENVQNTLKSFNLNMRWVRPENIHLTLKFLGDILPEALEPISQILCESALNQEALSIWAKGGGVFPGIKNPRVVWTGLCGQVLELKALQQTLAQNLARSGFAKDERAFKAHLTLGRVKGAVDPVRLNTALNAVAGFETPPFPVNRLVLFKSDLKPSGPVYTQLASAALCLPA